jgi:hypothetical protein
MKVLNLQDLLNMADASVHDGICDLWNQKTIHYLVIFTSEADDFEIIGVGPTLPCPSLEAAEIHVIPGKKPEFYVKCPASVAKRLHPKLAPSGVSALSGQPITPAMRGRTSAPFLRPPAPPKPDPVVQPSPAPASTVSPAPAPVQAAPPAPAPAPVPVATPAPTPAPISTPEPPPPTPVAVPALAPAAVTAPAPATNETAGDEQRQVVQQYRNRLAELDVRERRIEERLVRETKALEERARALDQQEIALAAREQALQERENNLAPAEEKRLENVSTPPG